MSDKQTTTVHFYFDEDIDGNIVNCVAFCSDTCHQAWCATNNWEYGGWNGAFETETPVMCSECGKVIDTVDEDMA